MKSRTRQTLVLSILILIAILALSGCAWLDLGLSKDVSGRIQASGVIEAQEVSVSSEIAGKVMAVEVNESDEITQGDLLFRLDPSIINAQHKQALAGLDAARSKQTSAEAALRAARAGLAAAEARQETARLQYHRAVQEARLQESEQRVAAWALNLPGEYQLPAWYFAKEEQRQAAQAELEQAHEAYQLEQEAFHEIRQDQEHEEITAAEERLAEAQAAFDVAQALLDRDVAHEGREELSGYRQSIFDAAEAELEAAQENYNQVLSETEAEDILDARARLAVAQERYQLTQDKVQTFHTGEDSFPVKIAKSALNQARASTRQAQAAVEEAQAGVRGAQKSALQAQSSLDLINLSREKYTVQAPVSGVILTRTIDPGEIVQPGMTALTIGLLDELTVTVYVPEDRYGEISLGDKAQLDVDSFPGQSFDAEVIRIADEAEYTPRNVQTKEERQKTVYAVELQVANAARKLKPGMPTDVTFQISEER